MALHHVLPDGESHAWDVEESLVIGREEGTRITDDPFLSSPHAEIRREGGVYRLRDLGSTNGTYVRVRGEIELQHGDYVMLGSQIFRYEI